MIEIWRSQVTSKKSCVIILVQNVTSNGEALFKVFDYWSQWKFFYSIMFICIVPVKEIENSRPLWPEKACLPETLSDPETRTTCTLVSLLHSHVLFMQQMYMYK